MCYKSILQSTTTLSAKSILKHLPIGAFVLNCNVSHVHFSDKIKPLWSGPCKLLDRIVVVTYELLSQDGSTFHTHRKHLIPYYPKVPLLYPHLRNFMRFSDTIQHDIAKPIKYANSDSFLFNSNESLSDEQSSQHDLSPSYQSKPLIPSSKTNHTSYNSSSNDNSPMT